MTDDGDGRDGPDCSPSPDGDRQARIDELLAALADVRRRYVLYYLRNEHQASLTETARQVAAWDCDRSPSAVRDETLEGVEIELYHVHLPMLEEADVLEYDERSEQLVFRDPPSLVECCLDQCLDGDLEE
ncbi:DUF7344 domain-containing protein [Halopiger xanaduensis]|uniref:DUF7344 domain-containing protein n=1 Tax=Halopiger xanaduensis (strain DSM 18323 / JCM 14033 / SH-6) TaxID=797210 RepID=F8D451_HALXS|nr:hypothetical protein [Halopiger xanaduensis]AEH37450.1 hypothetical protein Halxa_2834 [Halopiger xanaduensis SH-6]